MTIDREKDAADILRDVRLMRAAMSRLTDSEMGMVIGLALEQIGAGGGSLAELLRDITDAVASYEADK